MEDRKRTKKTGKQAAGGGYQKVIQEIASVYVFLIMAVYPFYFQNKYYDMGYAKWKFFLPVTLGAGAAFAAAGGYYLVRNFIKYRFAVFKCRRSFSITDGMMSAYFLTVLISTLLSPYREQVIWGYRGWYMGLAAQSLFVLIYYLVSRGWRWDNMAVGSYLAAAFLVFLLAVVMRFRIDPLGMYQNLEERYIVNFLTTIGQVTWYSGYVALLLPLGVFAFWFYDSRRVRILAGIFSAVGFMTVVTLNSDSIFIALGVMFLALFWFSMASNRKFGRFLEAVILCLASFKAMGICQRIFEERVVWPDGVSLFFSQSRITWLLMVSVILCLFGCKILEKKGKFSICKVKAVRVLVCGLVFSVIFLTAIYIYLNTAEKLPEQMRSDSNYLLFDEYWGNNRGFSWMIAVRSFLKGSAVRKIFGCGPDGFSLYVQGFFEKELAGKWGDSGMLACAHNEWLNALVNVGVLGAAVYAGIFSWQSAVF